MMCEKRYHSIGVMSIKQNHLQNSRIKWIDVAKFMAIIAVLIDHTEKILYTNHYIAVFSYYSVSLFILMMGITTMWSYYSNNKDEILHIMIRKCIGILRPYIVATVIYGVVGGRLFEFESLLQRIVRFDITPPFYYVILYVQLVIVSPILFKVFTSAAKSNHGLMIEIIGLAVVLAVSSLTTNYSNILNIYGGGGKLFGGSYLILLYIGMWFGRYYDKIHIGKIPSLILSIVSIVSTICWWRYIADTAHHIDILFPFGPGYNPPSVCFGVYAILMALSLYFIEMTLNHYPGGVFSKLFDCISYLGRHTLYIFLYHKFFLNSILLSILFRDGVAIGNLWAQRIVYFSVMIFGSILTEVILERAHKWVMSAYVTLSEERISK